MIVRQASDRRFDEFFVRQHRFLFSPSRNRFLPRLAIDGQRWILLLEREAAESPPLDSVSSLLAPDRRLDIIGVRRSLRMLDERLQAGGTRTHDRD